MNSSTAGKTKAIASADGSRPIWMNSLRMSASRRTREGFMRPPAALAAATIAMNASSIVGSGRSARRAAALIASGTPAVSTWPCAMINNRSQYSASSMKCVVTSTVTPASASALIRRQNSRRASGSTPEVGSSRNRMSGSCISAQARASRCLKPSAQIARRGIEQRIEPELRDRPVDARPLVRAREPVRAAVEPQILPHGQLAIEGELLRHVADSPARRRGRGAQVESGDAQGSGRRRQ